MSQDQPSALGTNGDYDPEAEAREVARIRAERDRLLTPSERLERLHRLCASLATIPRPRE